MKTMNILNNTRPSSGDGTRSAGVQGGLTVNVTRIAAAATLALSLAACAGHGAGIAPTAETPSSRAHFLKPQDSIGGIGTRTLSVNLLDAAPSLDVGTVQHINLAVTRIDVLQGNNYVTIASYDQPKMIDVLQHQYDDGAAAGSGLVNPVAYDGIRLVVDTGLSNAQTATQTYSLSFQTGSSQSSVGAGAQTSTAFESTNTVAMSVNQPISISTDQNNGIEMDFNAFETLANGGDSWLTARPTLLAVGEADASRIQGNIVNAQGNPVTNATVVAVDAKGTVRNTVATDATGHYLLHTLPSGTYQLRVYNQYTTASGQQQDAANADGSTTVDGGTVTATPGQVVTAATIND